MEHEGLKVKLAFDMAESLLRLAEERCADATRLSRLKNVNEIDEIFGEDSGEIRVDKFCCLGYEYAYKFGPLDSDAFDKARTRVEDEAIKIVRREANKVRRSPVYRAVLAVQRIGRDVPPDDQQEYLSEVAKRLSKASLISR